METSKRGKSKTAGATPLKGTDACPEPKPTGASRRGSLSREAIARRAYELYVERGCASGNAQEDWLKAEKELAQREDDEPDSAKDDA